MGDIYRSIPNKGSSAKRGIFTDLFQTKGSSAKGGIFLNIFQRK